jgi:Radical SAM superfamily
LKIAVKLGSREVTLANFTLANLKKKRFIIVLLKPSRYDADGYVIQWYRSAIPCNTIATLYGLADDCAQRQILGEDVNIDVLAYDETNRVLPIKDIITKIKSADGGFVGLVGVQSNQFPRSVEIARQFLAHDIAVINGGFHVSGCLSMLNEIPADIQDAIDLGITIYAGEAEGRFDQLVHDVWNKSLKPVYNYMDDLPPLEGSPPPFLPENVVRRTAGAYASFDAGRGCPYQCSFCSIINVQGRISRGRSPDDIEKIVRSNSEQGIKRFFFSDDNFARHRQWEAILDRLIHLREVEGFKFKFFMQVDALCHRHPNFINKAARAGCHWIYIGLESISPENLMAAQKRQNKIWEYRKMLQEWKRHGVMTYVGVITGFPNDTPETIARDIEIIKKELPVELVEFFFLTPLPGSADHKRAYENGEWMDPDMNKYALCNPVSNHPTMSKDDWINAYKNAWLQYYTDSHIETMMRRAASCGKPLKKMVMPLLLFYGSYSIEGIHPVESGTFRRKIRTSRRPGFKIENPFIFYPKRAFQIVQTLFRWYRYYNHLTSIAKRIEADPDKLNYMDDAMSPVIDEDINDLEMIQVYGKKANELQRAKIDLNHIAADNNAKIEGIAAE